MGRNEKHQTQVRQGAVGGLAVGAVAQVGGLVVGAIIACVGTLDGALVGALVGKPVGALVGNPVGALVGTPVGAVGFVAQTPAVLQIQSKYELTRVYTP